MTSPASPPPSPIRAALWPMLSYAILELAAIAAVLGLQPPPPQPVDAPLEGFSAGRAFRHVEAIAQAPRPAGSPQHGAARDRILAELRSLGLTPEVQAGERWGLPLENILARIPGSAGGGSTLALVAHYDSVAAGPGAADDAAGVAVLLETARALRHSGPLSNDVLLVFTDGEEAGLLGARLFVEEHPAAREVDLALNFEARGNRGPSLMFETSEGNGRLVAELLETAPRLVANSLSYAIYRLLPNDSDLTVLKSSGIAGLNFAFIDGFRAYHTPRDTPAALSLASLQHHGSYAFSLARRFGERDLGALADADAVYFNVIGSLAVAYPGSWAAPLALAAAAGFAALAVLAIRARRLRARGLLAGFLAFVSFQVLVAGGFALGAWAFDRILVRLGVAAGSLPWSGWGHFAFAAGIVHAVLLLAFLGYGRLRSELAAAEAASGAVLVWIVLLVLAAFLLPGASFLLLWPLLPALAGLAYVLFAAAPRGERPATRSLLSALHLPAVLLLSQALYLLAMAMSHRAWIAVLVVTAASTLLAGLLLPHLLLPPPGSGERPAR